MEELLKIDSKNTEDLGNVASNDTSNSFEEKRESLIILATLGETKEYLGEELTSEKNYKLGKKGINKYYSRYQLIQGKKVAEVIRERGIKLGIKIISYFIPIYSPDELSKELENDKLVNRELSNMVGLLVLKGGRFVALASGLIQIANHIIEPAQLLIRDEARIASIDDSNVT